jgi:hypothetical protein
VPWFVVDYDPGMAVYWRDHEKRLEPGVWDGLTFSVAECPEPGFVASICPPRRLRVSVCDVPVLWARVHNDYYDYELLRAEWSASLEIVPPIPFRLADDIAASAQYTPLQRWAKHFCQALSQSPRSPLSDGDWCLGPRMHWREEGSLSLEEIEGIFAHRSCERVNWCDPIPPIPLRDVSPNDSGRVKAWRKLARAGELPPVLLYWISGLAAYVVLDGHDRLLAAKLERVSAPYLVLERVSERQKSAEDVQKVWDCVGMAFEHAAIAGVGLQDSRKFTAEKVNRILLDAYTPFLECQPTVASPKMFSDTQWRSEVRNEAERQRVDVEELLDGS